MKKPISRILIINDEKLILKELIRGLNAAAKSLENPLGISFTGVTTAREALQAIEEILEDIVDEGMIRVHGELWSARSAQHLFRGQKVRVVGMEGLVLIVTSAEK